MNRRRILRTASIALLLASYALPTRAQMRAEEVALRKLASQSRMLSASTQRTFSAKAAAMADYGTIYDPATRDEFVSHALFVKLKKGHGSNPAVETAMLASRIGLPAASTSPLPFIGMADDPKVTARLRTLQGRKAARVAAAQDELRRMVELYYIPDIPPAEAAARLRNLPEVEIAEPIPVPHLLGPPTLPNDPLVEQQIAMLSHVMLPEAWDIWKGDTSMVIGVVDASIENTHEDLAPNIALNTEEMGTDAHGSDKRFNHIDDDGNGVVDDWHGANLAWQDDGTTPGETNVEGEDHGTKVAGLVAAATDNNIGIAGTAYRCRFFPVKAARSDGRMLYSYDGIIYCAKRNFKVINCSFGSNSYSQYLQDLITNLVTVYDCAIVAAAGNGLLYEAQFPAAYKHVLGVGSVDNDDLFKTTWGEQVGVSAPTGMSTIINNGYYPLAPATSFSAPLVSGILALVRSRYPNLTADQAMAHLRLTADPVPIPKPDSLYPPVPSQYRLTGYGRVNAFRSVSIDPFSHPAILVDSVWVSDESGHAQERIPVGGRGRIRLQLKNILGDATNVKVRAILYTDDSTAIAIDSTQIAAGNIRSGETKALADGIPFEVKLPNSNRVRIRFDITADSGYDDFQFERVLVYLPYTTIRTPKLTFSLTDMGRFGYEDYPNNTVGDGFRFDGAPFLYEGGLIIASDQTRVLSNVRGGFPSMQQNDFGTVEYPTALNNYTLTLSDSSAGVNRIGLQIRMRLVTVDTIPNAVGVEVRTRNTSAATIDSLRIGMFMDWDIDSNADRQEVHLVESPGKAVPFYGSATSASGYYLTHGVAGPVAHPIFYAIRNDTLPLLLYKGFGPDKKWLTVSNGIGSRSAGPTDISDISLVIGKNATGLAPGMEDTTLFVIGVSPIPSVAADAMQHLAFPGGPIASVGGDAESNRSALMITQPGAFSRVATISIGQVGRDASLRVYDAGGREVYDLSSQLARAGTPATIIFDGTSLPSGTYYIQLISSAGVESRRILLLR